MAATYPFTAIVGQEQMKLALVLNAINPRVGGVLVRGEKGTAKSTAARGLADLLPPLQVVDGCRFACDPQPAEPRCTECRAREAAGETLLARERLAAFVELPIGATEDRVLGTLDLERAIKQGERHFDPGLLARANRGLLYVDEVNLLPDHLVDSLLDAAAMGTNTVEREGLSFSHPAAFVLVGTMNPEEGELRPQLLDRFGLTVDVAGMPDAAARAEVVRRRIAYEADPRAFAERWQAAEKAERERIVAARTMLSSVHLDDHLLDLIARICTQFEVDGLRADIVIYKTAATLAAYAGRAQATAEDVRRAAELALPHRRRRQPFDAPGLDHEGLDRLVDEHAPQSTASEAPDRGAPPDAGQAQSPPDQVFEVAASPPLNAPSARIPGTPLAAATVSRGINQRTAAKVESPRGRHVRSVGLHAGGSSLDVLATLLAAAPHQVSRRPASGMRLERHDIRLKIRETRMSTRTLFVVDASGSMAAQRRMAAAKGAVVSLLTDAYQQRNEVGLIGFRGTRADLLLPLTTSADLAFVRLRDLPTGGRTPLAAALRLAQTTLARARTNPTPALVVLVSDGRANVGISGDAHEDALAAARALRASGVAVLVVDTEDGPVQFGRARHLCEVLGGQYVRLGTLPDSSNTPQPLAAAVRAFYARTEK